MTVTSKITWLLLCFTTAAAAQSTRVEVSAGEPAQLAASSERLDFLLKAKTRSIVVPGADSVALVAAPNKTGDQIMLAAPLRTKPGEYTATLTAISATGQQQQTTLTVPYYGIVGSFRS